jgi:hypothetical protein
MKTKPSYDRIPEELRQLDHWLVWKIEQRPDKDGQPKPTKVPYNACTHRKGKSNDPATWSSFEEARKAFEKGGYTGIGFAFTDTKYTGVDLDGCRDKSTGEVEPWAEQILSELDSYAENSPNDGVHSIVLGQLPPGRRQFEFGDRPHHGVGFYDRSSPRYFTMTGAALNGNAIEERSEALKKIHTRLFPLPPEPKPTPASGGSGAALLDDDELLRLAFRAKNGDKFRALWQGDSTGYPSPSEADLALANHLAFWTGKDAAQMERLFRQSGRMREKILKRPKYLADLIQKAIAGCDKVYVPTANFTGTGKPAICLSVPKLDTVIGESIRVLREAHRAAPRFFVQGHRMVHVVKDAKGRAGIAEAGEVFLLPELERVADFYKRKDGGKAAARPTLALTRGILARPQRERELPELRGVVTGPVLRADGTLIATPGYDAALRLYYAPTGKLALPPIPDRPTPEECARAADMIGDVIAEFPFVGDADRANYFALLLTPLVRHNVENVPLALLDSPKQGTGKTLLADVLGLIHEGQPPTKWTVPYSQEAWEKILTTILLGGRAITVFDNVETALQAPVLAKLLTSSEHSDRMMRTHTEMRIPNTTMFAVTGNNIRLGGDLARRSYQIRLDARVARPWERRRFKYPFLKAHVKRHRGELLGALLTMSVSDHLKT